MRGFKVPHFQVVLGGKWEENAGAYGLPIVAIALLFIFQPELRRGLIMLGRSPFFGLLTRGESATAHEVFEAVIRLSRDQTGALIAIQREVVSKKFDQRINIADGGRYSELLNVYPDSTRRNQMVNSLYGFVNSFGTAPVSFVDVTESNEISEIYKIKKFKSETRNSLLAEIEPVVAEPQEYYGVGKIKLTTIGKKTKKKIEEIYTKSNTTLSYAPDVIVHQGDSYLLNFPLRCSLEKEDGYYMIQSELLDIVGTGETEDEAEINFAEEFSFIYKRYNELTDEKLSDRIVSIKTILNYLVKSVEK